jgi:hypothetical protein
MNHEDIQELFLEINQELDSVEEISVNFIATKSAAKKLFVIRKIMKSVYDLDDETIDKYIFTKVCYKIKNITSLFKSRLTRFRLCIKYFLSFYID